MKFLRNFSQYLNESYLFESFRGGWADLSEGMRVTPQGSIEVDFKEDRDTDVVKLAMPTPLKVVRKEKVPVYRGYVLDRVDQRPTFMELVKRAGAMTDDELKKLIDLTYPAELFKKSVKIIFTTGSSDPLAVRIAETLKNTYYPEAKIVDVLKQYYGTLDPKDMIDWERYENADPATQEMINAFLRRFERGANNAAPRSRFEGYIKKSLGLQSGARHLLKKGHNIDDFIVDRIKMEENKWKQEYVKNRSINPGIAVRYRPAYLVVDDTIIEGSTIKGIFKEMKDVLTKPSLVSEIGQLAAESIYGYCLFSYKAN